MLLGLIGKAIQTLNDCSDKSCVLKHNIAGPVGLIDVELFKFFVELLYASDLANQDSFGGKIGD